MNRNDMDNLQVIDLHPFLTADIFWHYGYLAARDGFYLEENGFKGVSENDAENRWIAGWQYFHSEKSL